VTKRRPWWSDIARWAAAFAAACCCAKPVDCLGGGQEDNGQAGTSPAGQEGGAQTGAAALPASDFGPADILDDDGPGLHGQASFYGKGFQGARRRPASASM
jgi:rare lipoprotein A